MRLAAPGSRLALCKTQNVSFPRSLRWGTVAFLWLALILFSSTNRAGFWADEAFTSVWNAIVHKWRLGEPAHRFLMIAAEKSCHLLMFGTLAIVLWYLLPPSRAKNWLILSVGALVGAASEILQRFFVTRDPTVRDFLLNVAGTALGILVAGWFAARASKPSVPEPVLQDQRP
jgi:VanZ family protein